MRQDARSLLERLGRNEFRYQEFDDPFADMELWPIFEALLRDPNIVGHRASALRNGDVQIRSAKPADAPETLLSRYGKVAPDVAAVSPSGPAVNLRQFFDRFSEGK